MNDVVLLVAVGAVWLVSLVLIRARLMQAVGARRISVGTAAVILGLLFGVLPLPTLIWRPEALALLVFTAALLFFVGAGSFWVSARIRGLQ